MSVIARKVSMGYRSRAKTDTQVNKSHMNAYGTVKSTAMKSNDWRKTAQSLTSSESQSSRAGIYVPSPGIFDGVNESGSEMFEMADASNLSLANPRSGKDVSWEQVNSKYSWKPDSSDDETTFSIDSLVENNRSKEYAAIYGVKPYMFKVGGKNGEVFESKKLSLIDIKLAEEEEYAPSTDRYSDRTWCLLEYVGDAVHDIHYSPEITTVEACTVDQREIGPKSKTSSPKERDAYKLMSADPAIDSIGGVIIESPHKRKNSSEISKMRFLDLVTRLNNTYAGHSQSYSGTSLQPDLSHLSVNDILPKKDMKNNVPGSCPKKLNPMAAEFKTVSRLSGSPPNISPKKFSRPTLANIFPDAVQVNHQQPSTMTQCTLQGLSGCPSLPNIQPPPGFNVPCLNTNSGTVTNSCVRTGKFSQNGLSCNNLPIPPVGSGVMSYNNPPTGVYGLPTQPCPKTSASPVLPPLGMDRMNNTNMNQFSGSHFHTFPQRGDGTLLASCRQATPSSSSTHPHAPLGLPPLPNNTAPTMNMYYSAGTLSGGNVPDQSQFNHFAHDRPFFPVTRKPRGSNPWEQMEYERFLEWRKANEPGYHMGCKMRQAQRVVRHYQQQQGGPA